MNHTLKGVRTIISTYCEKNGLRVCWSGRDSLLHKDDEDAFCRGSSIHFSRCFTTPGRLALAFCHELGHMAVDKLPHEKRRTQLEDELAAWSLSHQFHRKIFKCNPSSKDERYITECLRSYTKPPQRKET